MRKKSEKDKHKFFHQAKNYELDSGDFGKSDRITESNFVETQSKQSTRQLGSQKLNKIPTQSKLTQDIHSRKQSKTKLTQKTHDQENISEEDFSASLSASSKYTLDQNEINDEPWLKYIKYSKVNRKYTIYSQILNCQ